MRRLLLLGSIVVFLDVVFYAAITPLLPDYVDDLGLSKAAAGVLSAAYAAGTLVASLPAGFMAARVGPRRTLISGLLLLGLASLVFGFAQHVVLLDAARFVQGVAGALAWAGALTWLILATPEERRGSVIGDVLGIAIAGALLGPVLGALAVRVGTEPVFASVLVLTVALALAALRIPEPGRGERHGLREAGHAITRPSVLRATWYVAAPSAMFGVIEVLIPLRIDAFGGGAGLIAAGFMVGSGARGDARPTGRPALRPGRQASSLHGGDADLRRCDRPRPRGRGAGRDPGRPDRQLPGGGPVLRPGAGDAERLRRRHRPAPGPCRRADQCGVGVGTGARRRRGRRRGERGRGRAALPAGGGTAAGHRCGGSADARSAVRP